MSKEIISEGEDFVVEFVSRQFGASRTTLMTLSGTDGSVDFLGGAIHVTKAGVVKLNGTAVNSADLLLDTTLAANKFLKAAAGTGVFDFSPSSGTFKTSTGTNTLGGNVVIAGSKTFATGTGTMTLNGTLSVASGVDVVAAGGASDLDYSLSSGVWKGPTGLTTWAGKQAATAAANTVADPGTGVAIPVTSSGMCPLTIGSAGAETNTLAIPTFAGQWLDIVADTVGTGTRAITCAQAINSAGNTVMTFNAAWDRIRLDAVTIGGALRWAVSVNTSVSLS